MRLGRQKIPRSSQKAHFRTGSRSRLFARVREDTINVTLISSLINHTKTRNRSPKIMIPRDAAVARRSVQAQRIETGLTAARHTTKRGRGRGRRSRSPSPPRPRAFRAGSVESRGDGRPPRPERISRLEVAPSRSGPPWRPGRRLGGRPARARLRTRSLASARRADAPSRGAPRRRGRCAAAGTRRRTILLANNGRRPLTPGSA